LVVHAASPPSAFPEPVNSQKASPAMSAAEAAASATLPPGFRMSVFAAEPEVMNPLAMNWDSRGRLWVAENFTFSESLQRGQANSFNSTLRDRIAFLKAATAGSDFARARSSPTNCSA
jgi:hypothetical protein